MVGLLSITAEREQELGQKELGALCESREADQRLTARMATSCNVRVIARFRPFNQRELGLGCDKVHTIQGSQRVDIQCDGHPKRSFAFDQVFGEDSRQRDVYSILQVRLATGRAPSPPRPSTAQRGRGGGREGGGEPSARIRPSSARDPPSLPRPL